MEAAKNADSTIWVGDSNGRIKVYQACTRSDGSQLITTPACGKYIGQIEPGSNDVFHGFGEFTAPDGKSYYIGQWKKGKRNGYGIEFDSAGGIYFGMWKNDLKNGDGVLEKMDSSVFSGTFQNGKTSGMGTLYLPTGHIVTGKFDENGAKDATTKMEEIPIIYPAPKPKYVKSGKKVVFETTNARLFPEKWAFVELVFYLFIYLFILISL